MHFVQPAGRRSRRSAYVKAGAVALAAISLMAGIVSACSSGDVETCDPANWAEGDKSPGYVLVCCDPPGQYGTINTEPLCPNEGTDGGIDAGDGGDAMADGPIEAQCPGQCLPWPPVGWGTPELMWIGPESEAPACPDPGLLADYQGAIDLDAGALPCGECGCEPPDGGCTLPTTLTTNAATCAAVGPSTVQTPFNAPPGWDGGCITFADAIAAGALCDGSPCVVSLTIAAPTVAESGCTAIQPPTPAAPPTSSYAVACIGEVALGCATGFFCLPPATAFRVCVAEQGDVDCPGVPYTEKHLAFAGMDDARSCSPCTCGAPSGDKCTVTLSIYPDDACAMGVTLEVPIDSTGPLCDGVLPGAAVGSESATPPVYEAGSCEPSGGVPGGSVTPSSPTTFCCISSTSGPPTP
jgi:hypothetical protein